MPDEVEVRRLVCIGRRVSKKNELAWFWQDERGRTYGWQQDVIGPAAPGSLYDVSFGPEGEAVLSGPAAPRYVGRLDVDDPRVLRWTAEERVAEVTVAQEERAREEAGPDAVSEACEPLRQAYRAMVTPARRAALLTTVIEEVTR